MRLDQQVIRPVMGRTARFMTESHPPLLQMGGRHLPVGHVAVQKNPEFPVPDLVRNVVADKASAYTVAQAITAALFARERGAGGQHLRVPMLDASLAFFWPDGMMEHTMVGDGVRAGPTLYQIYRVTRTADGHLIYFAVSDVEFHGLFRALGRPEWAEDPRFRDLGTRIANAPVLEPMIREEFAKWWTETHAPDIQAEQVPHLVGYIVNVAVEDNLAAKPDVEPEWDGIAEEWFPTEAAFNAVYGKEDRDAHEDAESNTSRVERLVVREIKYV